MTTVSLKSTQVREEGSPSASHSKQGGVVIQPDSKSRVRKEQLAPMLSIRPSGVVKELVPPQWATFNEMLQLVSAAESALWKR